MRMGPSPSGVSAAPGVRRYSRDDIVRLGQAGKPWEFLPVVFQALGVAPKDVGLRVLAAANLAQVGLGTAAREQLEHIPATLARDPALAGLWKAVAGLRLDRVLVAELLEACRANVARLAERGVDLAPALEHWEREQGAGGWEWFRAGDGNLVRRRTADGAWAALGDARGFAERFAREKLGTLDARANQVVVEGADPPWMLQRILEATARHRDGFQPRVVLVQEDAQELLAGFAQADLPALAEERVTVIVGPGAPARLRAWMASRAGFKLAGPLIASLSVRRKCEPGVQEVIASAEREQEEEHTRLAAEVASVYDGRDRAWWGRRWAEALESTGGRGGAAPSPDARGAGSTDLAPRLAKSVARLRVLVPTSRFSTFIKHASSDLVEALNAAGCEARLLTEPDDCTRLGSVAWLRAVRDLEPDLVVLINHFRSGIGEWMPRNLPFVTWVQDAMPQHFDAEVGKGLGALDFIAGHLHEEMFERFGFPRERTLRAPVVASESKFHDGPCEGRLLDEHACEVALVSHHGETPERMHARLVTEAGTTTATARTIEAIWPRLVALVVEFGRDPWLGGGEPRAANSEQRAANGEQRTADSEHLGQNGEQRTAMVARSAAWEGSLHAEIAAIVREGVSRHLERSAGVDERARALVLKTYALPVADRLLRHQTVAWAAALARERRWRLRLYGRGWADSPELREFARPEVEHGEALRACYAAASAHLHISIHTCAHQRVMECALSGGLPLCRMLPEVLIRPARVAAHWAAAVRGEPVELDAGRGLLGYAWPDQPETAAYAALLERAGLPLPRVCWVPEKKRDAWRAAFLRGQREAPTGECPDPALLVDPGETAFCTRERLAALVEAASQRPAWREGWSRAIAGRVHGRYTHARFVEDALAMVSRGLGVEIEPRPRAGPAPDAPAAPESRKPPEPPRAAPAAKPAPAAAPLPEPKPAAMSRRPPETVPRVVTLIAPDGVSGVSSAMARLARLAEPHYRWRILAVGESGPGAAGDAGLPGAETPGFSTIRWAPGTRPVEQVRLIRERVREMRASVVSPNFLAPGFIAAALDRHRGVRCAALFHGSELAAEDLYSAVAPLADAWRAVSPAIARRIARYAPGGPLSPALPTGIEAPDACTPLPCTRSRHEPLRLLYAGRLEERVKRITDLAALADALDELGVPFRLTIAGQGPAAGKLASALADHIVAGRVHIAGAVPQREMGGLYEAHDVLVLVSQMEGTPAAVMEAMARARPVAITRGCGGALEAVRDGAEGVVVDVGNVELMAEKLAALNRDRASLARMGERARRAALDLFDLRALAPRFDALVEEAGAAPDDGNTPAAVAALWARILVALGHMGDCTAAELCGLLIEWLADRGITGVLVHRTEAVEGLVGELGRGDVVGGALGGGPRWFGWPGVEPASIAEGSLVITGAPEAARALLGERAHLLPLVLPRIVNFASQRVLAAAAALRARGCSRFVLYGAGKHTLRLAAALERTPEIVGIVDDRAGERGGPPERLWGLPVVKPPAAAGLGYDAVIVSSDEFERAMTPRASLWAGARPVVALYAPIETPGGEIADELTATSPRV